ncbi:polyphosphate kinase 1 [Scytonema sp. UIC 10036]|uniref:polyphosphate kinase 1 n=1 Tax=Scytonema sp. UIC 10036 TaxID=2304196 RepID=UPI0012DA6CE9|nr:polyphosphate kinase 1 [Scytonema sp. UIC 10036]MUG95503.1 polyphosphate kinase 1 [Scytonema sp. UIC 10036]
MPKAKESKSTVKLNEPQYYFNRELSWLEFNNRVLHEALDSRTLLLERLKFAAIFSSNLDEFFMVRVSGLKEQVEAEVSQLTPDGRTPQEQLDAIERLLRPQVVQQHRHFEQELRSKLSSVGVYLLKDTDLNQEQRVYLERYFEKHIFPILTPLAVDPGHPFPHMSNLSLNLGVVVKNPKTGEENFARVKVPDIVPRFITFPQELQCHNEHPTVWTGVPLEQVIACHIQSLFPGMEIQESCVFRVTRDADFPVQEDEAEDLLLAIQHEISKRYFKGSAVRLEIQASGCTFVRKTLMQGLKLAESDVYDIEGLLNLKDLMFFMSLPLPDQKDSPWTPVVPPRLRQVHELSKDKDLLEIANGENLFLAIQQGDLLVHHPYESFSESVELFITKAATDPKVLAIKMTLYRTSGDSPIVKALIAAAENKKQVAVLVELKARFDEENNISWARQLEDAGVHVVYGLVGLKTHTKTTLVVRKEGDDIRRYVHIGTGNYNSKTAKLYTDLGLFSCREDLGADLTDLFNYLTGYSLQHSYRKLLVSPVNMRDRMVSFIRREIDHCQNGHPGRIIAKMNSLVDPQMIATLYEASQAGVQIDLIIRGICCLRPGVKGVSENIRVISIVGRYLEHSRIFYFHNNGQEEIYIGSADWMPRNLDRRVEAVVPIEDANLVKQLKNILDIMLADNRQAWELQPDGQYLQRRPGAEETEQSAQKILMEMALQHSL